MEYKSFELLNKISFVRTGGSKEELKAANILIEECNKLGIQAHLEDFQVDGYEVSKASLKFLSPDFEVECCGVGMSSSTSEEGICGEFTYVNSLQDAIIQDLKGKVCLIDTKLINPQLYKKLVEKQAAALILCCGSVYLDTPEVDLDPYMYREINYSKGKIPAVCIRMKDAEKVLRANPKHAVVTMIETELKNNSHNVVATIKGSKYEDEIVVFTAHYDSVSYSNGAYDNATGSTGIMQLLAYFAKHQPARTLKFVWCGSEEMGLLGSKAYIQTHKEDLEKYRLCINIDMIGVTLGRDIACCSSNETLVSYINYLGCEVGFAIAARKGVYSSDSTPFADNGVPSVSFARLAPKGGAEIHSRKDVLDFLHEDNYYKTCSFICLAAERLVNSVVFPLERSIPKDIKDEIDVYFKRVEKN